MAKRSAPRYREAYRIVLDPSQGGASVASPFPGMDPFLESPAHWPDFHARFINYWCEAVADLLPANYSARLGERMYLVERPVNGTPAGEVRQWGGPDVVVERRTSAPTATVATPAAVATLEPVTIPLLILDEERETYIEILHRPDRTLVAVLELLSPTNKEQPGRALYLAKRNALLRQDVHLVELDLLIGGQRLRMGAPLPAGHYYAFVSRAERRPACQVYAWTLPQALPALPIPLRPPDADIAVNHQAVFATTYERGRYRPEVDYQAAAPVRVEEATRTWIAERVQGLQP